MDALTARTAHTPVEAHAEPYRLRRAPMDSLNWLAVAALALILVIFYFVRKIPAYLALSFVVAVGYAGATAAQVDWHLPSEWMVIVIGLLFWSFGLLIVRLMLVRSVSLRLLARMEGIIPALEYAHALAELIVRAPRMKRDQIVILNVSGRGDKDMEMLATFA